MFPCLGLRRKPSLIKKTHFCTPHKMLNKIVEIFYKFFAWMKMIIFPNQIRDEIIPISVNYHFTRQCNYSCGFCFHTAKTSFLLPLEKVSTCNATIRSYEVEPMEFQSIVMLTTFLSIYNEAYDMVLPKSHTPCIIL